MGGPHSNLILQNIQPLIREGNLLCLKMEEVEEGEIPDEDQSQLPGVKRDIPLLQKRVSLDDLLSRQRTLELSRRDDRETRGWREDDSIKALERNRWEDDRAWKRDVPYASSPGSNKPYPSNLYHFAWAQAVKEGPTKAERLPGVPSLVRSNSRKLELQSENGMPRRDHGIIHPEDRSGLYIGSRQRNGGDGVLDTPEGRPMRWTRGLDDGRELHREGLNVSSLKVTRDNLVEKGKGTPDDKLIVERRDGSADTQSFSTAVQNKGIPDLKETVDAIGSLQAPVGTGGAVSGCVETTGEGVEDREEGELEEGEIELADQSSRGSPSGQSGATERLSLDRHEMRERSTSSRSKGAGRGPDRTDSGYYSRERSSRQFHADHPKHQYLRELDIERESSKERWEREKLRQTRELDMEREKLEKGKYDEKKLTFERKDLLSMATKLVKNATVKDAQKSFSSVCKRLCKSLKLLDDLSTSQEDTPSDGGSGRLPSDVSGLARQAFSGIRSVFTIWNTASGREQERDKELFPRLLDLATGLCPKLFKKESRELEGMRQTVAKAGRGLSSLGTGAAPGEEEKQILLSEAKQESPGNSTSATTQVEIMSRLSTETESTAETTTGGATNGLADAKQAVDAAAIAAAAIAYAQSSAAARATPHVESRYNNAVSQVPGVRMDSWSWPTRNPLHNQLPSSGIGGLLVPPARPILHMASSARPIPPPMPVYKPWTEPDRHELDTNNVWPGQAKLNPSLHVAARSHTLGILGPLPQTVGPKPQMLGSLPHYTSAPYTFQNIEDEWEEMSPPGGSTYLSSSLATSKGNTTEFRPANSWLPRFEQQRNGTPYRSGLLSGSLSSMFADGRLPSPTPSEEDEGLGGTKESSGLTSASERHQLVDRSEPLVSNPLQIVPVASTLDPVSAPRKQNLELPLPVGGPHVCKGQGTQLLPQNAAFGMIPKGLEPEPSVSVSVSSSQPGAPSLQKYEQGSYGVEMNNDIRSFERSETTSGVIRKQDAVDTSTWETANAKRQRRGRVGQGIPGVAGLGGWLEDGSGTEVHPDDGPIDMEVDEEIEKDAAARSKENEDSMPDLDLHVTKDGTVAEGSAILAPVDKRDDGPALGDAHSNTEVRGPDLVEEHKHSEVLQQEVGPSQKTVNVDGSTDLHQTISGSPGNSPADGTSAVEAETSAVEVCLAKSVHGQTEKVSKPSFVGRKNRASTLWGATQNHPDLEHLLESLDDAERFAVQQERERRMAEQERMLRAKKLCLVLDLDHTLLNSAKFTEIEPEWEHRLRATEAAERTRAGHGRRELYRFAHMGMWTKLRPGIWKFLARASELYELHVYTMGNRVYATEMAKLLDPTGELFAGRVISKGDDAEVVDGDDKPPKSKDLDGVMGMESAVVIIDDSVRVWPHHSQNLIVVERYMYFPCSRRQFGLSGPSLLEVGHDERETDGMLASALAVVDNIHTAFFSHQALQDVDVRSILAGEQRKVLGGCRVVFSRVFPVGELQPQCHPLWRMAEQFGAVCTVQTDDEVTHVVAISLGTDKVNWAQATGRHVVRPAWIEASAILYRRANERDFMLAA